MTLAMTLPLPTVLSAPDNAALAALYRRGTPENTLRAYERDLAYLSAWKAAAFEEELAWPETAEVALRFLLDHARDLSAEDSPARETAAALIAAGLRRSLRAPAPATLDRKIASWRAFHRMKGLKSPFEEPLLRDARAKARRANAKPKEPKSPNPITRDVLEAMLGVPDASLRGLRDRAMLMLAWASGGRRRSEVVALNVEDIDQSELVTEGHLWLRLRETKTTGPEDTPRLILKGRAARVVAGWIKAAGLSEGPLFRPISKGGRVLKRRLAPDALRVILRTRLKAAGYPEDFATPHGLRSGFLTQAALDGAPLPAAMRLSLHRSPAQAMAYYQDVELSENPAADLLE